MNKNLFITALTNAAPTSNYRGESQENRTPLQKISKNGQMFSVISSESIRNALREMLSQKGLELNRHRLHNEEQLAVEFKDLPNPDKFADDFIFGYMCVDSKEAKKMEHPTKRDSVLRINIAEATSPYKNDATFHQSPKILGKWKNANTSVLLLKEVHHTAYQFPVSLRLADFKGKENWRDALLESIVELNGVAGGHARSYYEMAPKSFVARLTKRLVAGFNTYGFDQSGNFADLARINENDLPGSEFIIAGEIVRNMTDKEKERLKAQGATLIDSPQRAMDVIIAMINA